MAAIGAAAGFAAQCVGMKMERQRNIQ